MANPPAPTREPGQRSLDIPMWFGRYIPPWGTPEWIKAASWRRTVRNQPICMLCREALMDNILALDWKVAPKDSNKLDELKSEIEYYTDLFDEDYAEQTELLIQDVLDLPFGFAAEVGRENDEPEGRVLWIEPLDGATLSPTNNDDFPVAQRIPELVTDVVYFPKHAINRVYLTPRPEIKRKGYGMPPPEKIYLALEALARGDYYYANLLLDTPAAGILDLGDMEKLAAEEWVKSFRELMTGLDPLKIPVLYEHTTKPGFIAFGQPPTAIMYDKIYIMKASITAAGYGLTLSDIGFSSSESGGDTLAGKIRDERRSRRGGLAVLKRKIIAYRDRMLPKTLKFAFVDYDDEVNLNVSRARLGNATAMGALIDKQVITPGEGRRQFIADGLFTIAMPEEIPSDELPVPAPSPTGPQERPGLLGAPQPPSTGGWGGKMEERAYKSPTASATFEGIVKRALEKISNDATDVRIRRLIRSVAKNVYNEVRSVLTELSEQDLDLWNIWHDKVMFGEEKDTPAETLRALDNSYEDINKPLDEDEWWLFDVEMEAILTALTLSYIASMKSTAQELVEILYEYGFIDSPYIVPMPSFQLTNEKVIGYLEGRAASMVTNVNDGTKYYLQRILISSVRKSLTEPEIINLIKNGVDIEEILNDNIFMQKLSQSVQEEIASMTDARLQSIVSFEIRSAENQAQLDQYKRVGLASKKWNHFGADTPCEVCESNEKEGYVPLDFEFQSVFGTCQTPPAHPHEHCGIGYNRSELFQRMLSGKFKPWTGD